VFTLGRLQHVSTPEGWPGVIEQADGALGWLFDCGRCVWESCRSSSSCRPESAAPDAVDVC